jgi:cytochrome c5
LTIHAWHRAALLGGALLTALAALLAASGCGAEDRTAEEIFPRLCARCHGEDGKGAPQQVRLYPKANLSASELRGIPGRRAIYRRIAEGYGPMPGYAHKLSQAEIERLVDYCVKLQTPVR